LNKIEVGLINDQDVMTFNRFVMKLGAKISQHGHEVRTIADLKDKDFLQSAGDKLTEKLCSLPHPTLQKFVTIPLLFIGVSRRFLAQITRHQNDIKFMSSSFQYGDHSNDTDFVVPVEVLRQPNASAKERFENAMFKAHREYKELVPLVGKDAAAYVMPQSTRVMLLAVATPYQWKHMIGQRICKRNTTEMRYVMLHAWNCLFSADPYVFSPETTGPVCMRNGRCPEGKMTCGDMYIRALTPMDILTKEFGDIMRMREEDEYVREAE
jgi:thymidylate synthase (FAD)